MSTCKGNFFSDIPKKIPDELFETIVNKGAVKIERIVSKGHSSPENFWYDQDWGEFVVLLSGSAVLHFQDEPSVVALEPGSYIYIPPHQKHRVESTDQEKESVWLAVHFNEES